MEGSSKETTIDDLFNLTMDRKWDEVVKVYRENSWAHTAKLTKSEETALHVAVSNYHSEEVKCYACSIREMINCFSETKEILSMRNDKGDTPLHLAAAVGWVDICDFIASKHWDLIKLRNYRNETPLFVAAYHGNLKAFVRLHEIYSKKGVHNEERDHTEEGDHPDDSLYRRKDEGDHAEEGDRAEEGAHPEEEDHPDDSLCRRKDGNTILHFAISGEHFELAYQIISYYPKLVNSFNEDGESPLHVLAKKPNVFKSTSHMRLYDSIIYHCVSVDKLGEHNPETKQIDGNGDKCHSHYPDNYHTCIDIVQLLHKNVTACVGFDRRARARDGKNQRKAKDAGKESKNIGHFPANYATCILLFKVAMTVILTFLGVGFARIKKIKEKKQKHEHAIQIMNQMIDSESSYKYNSDGQKPVLILEPQYSERIPFPDTPPPAENLSKESDTQTTSSDKPQSTDNENEEHHKKSDKQGTPVLIAAKMGILEMVEKVLSKCPIAIQDLDSKGKNVLMLAAENRQTSVFNYLMKEKLPEYVFHQLDNDGNSILHLAAMLGDQQPWHIPGAALQMQWEVKWYEHVKSSIPSPFFAYNNKKGETPRKIFSETHKSLTKEGTDWLIKTSESCSVVAALIAGVAFATSATVPGGLNEQTGHPILENNPTFDIFSVSSLVALCLSITALVYFLAILTSRGQEYDFKRNLPRKLLKGLTALFASIAAMLVSFCAGHTFVLANELRLFNMSIYAIACIPLTLFAIAQLPLYFDLFKANYKKVPLRSYNLFH